MSDRSIRRFAMALIVFGLVFAMGGMGWGLSRMLTNTVGTDHATGADFEIELAAGGHTIWQLANDGVYPDLEVSVRSGDGRGDAITMLPASSRDVSVGSGGTYAGAGRFEVAEAGTYVITTSPPGSVVNIGRSMEQAAASSMRFIMIGSGGFWAVIAGVILLIATRDRRPKTFVPSGPFDMPPPPSHVLDASLVTPQHPPAMLAPPTLPPPPGPSWHPSSQ